jgi:transcription initiation factor IIE alpha subunit
MKEEIKKCNHGDVEFLGEQKGDKCVNRYFRCLKCGSVLVLSEEGVLYEVPKQEGRKHFK